MSNLQGSTESGRQRSAESGEDCQAEEEEGGEGIEEAPKGGDLAQSSSVESKTLGQDENFRQGWRVIFYIGIAIGFLLGAPSGAYIICCFMGRIGGVMVKQLIKEGLIERGRAL